MSPQIRPLTPGDYPAVVALQNTYQHVPATVESKARFIATFPAAYPAVHLVAETEGRVAGYAVAYKASWIMADRARVHVVVDPALRGRGIGGALLAALQPFVQAHTPARLATEVRDDDAQSLAWAERRGFAREHHFFDSVLPLAEFDPTPFGDHVAQVEHGGFRLVPFDTIQGPATEQELYRFHHQLMADMPNGSDVAKGAFPDWRDWLLGGTDAWPQGCLIAMDADGHWAGMTAVKLEDGHAHVAFTGVARSFRGHGLALALKLKGIELLRQAGATEVHTVNHAANGPMLAVNRKLGYRPLPGHYFMVKSVER